MGERIDGYLGVVDSGAPAEVKRLVEQINAERQAKYAEIAKQQGAPVQAVAQIAGEKLVSAPAAASTSWAPTASGDRSSLKAAEVFDTLSPGGKHRPNRPRQRPLPASDPGGSLPAIAVRDT